MELRKRGEESPVDETNMIFFRTLEALSSRSAPIVLAAGAFDGVHRGHQALIAESVRTARARKGEAWVLTFDPHPSKVLHPDNPQRLLTSTPHKMRLFEQLGPDGCVLVPFTREFSAIEPEDFVEQLCRAAPTLSVVIVGTNWTFGRRAQGNTPLLRELAVRYGFDVRVPEPVLSDGAPISSTRIRHAVEQGRLDDLEAMLGRPFSLMGTVSEGRRLGRELGFPTANIRLQDEVRPPSGVYVIRADIDGTRHEGAAYLGKRPKAGGHDVEHILEAHLFDMERDLYGKAIEVFFLEKLRPDRRFPDHESLRAQIARDVEQARNWREKDR